MLCLSCNVKNTKTPAIVSEKSRNKCDSNHFQQCPPSHPRLYCYRYLVALHEPGTKNLYFDQ